jgi:hypothetical protein
MITSPSPGGILMTSTHPFPSLPQPQPPAAAASALADAAGAAARAWAQPLSLARHQRAVSQLYSTLRDLGIAARGLAAWQVPGTPSGPAPREFARHVTAGARRFLDAWNCLDGVLAFEGLGPLPDPGEPGAALCHAARNVIPAWRQPSGSSDYRDAAIRAFITATGLVSAAALGLATYAPRRTAIGLQAAVASLAEAIADLSAAIEAAATDRAREDAPTQPLPGNRWPDAGEEP